MKKLLFLTLLVCLKANAVTILEPMVGYTRISMANDDNSEFMMSGFIVGGKVGFQRDQSTYGLRALFGPSLDAKADPTNDVVEAIINITDFSYSQIGLFSQSSINEKVNFFFGFDFAYKITLEALGQKDESDNCVSHLIDPSRNLCRVISRRPKLLILPICILALSFLILSLIFFSTILLL